MRLSSWLGQMTLIAICLSCSQGNEAETVRLSAPSALVLEQQDETSVLLQWQDRAEGETGYRVFRRAEGAEFYVDPVAELSANATHYLFEGLEPGASYAFGVQATAATPQAHSEIVYTPKFTLTVSEKPEDPEPPKPEEADPLAPTLLSQSSSYAFLSLVYHVKGSDRWPAHGICLSEAPNPTLEDQVFRGPSVDGIRTVTQVIPNAALAYGKTYHFRVYQENEGAIHYSPDQEIRLGDEPALPALSWTRVENPVGVPASVEVYATDSELNGRPFRAWYAVADCSQDVELRVLAPKAADTIDKLMPEDGYVLVNGGFFTFDGSWKSPYVVDAVRTGDGYGSDKDAPLGWTLVTPAVLGVDAQGKPAAYWWAARPGVSYYFTQPLPTTPGEARYWYEGDGQEASFPEPSASWEPYNAISAGPMVLYEDKVVVDDTRSVGYSASLGNYYVSNYELLASDIFPGAIGNMPDRTCIGFRPDGRVVLFICDGRVDESRGASLPELGLIMRSLGCVSAMNLDGGGSTGMMLGRTHLNTWEQGLGTSRTDEYRKVFTAIGFFKKRK